MKRSFIVALTIVAVIIPALVFGGMFDLSKKPDTGGANVDVNALSARATALMSTVTKATIAFGEALVEIEKAIGNAAAAEKLQTAIDNAKSKKDDDSTKVLVGEVNNAVSDLNQMDLESKMDSTQARVCVGKSILKLGSGCLLDMHAVSDAKALVTESSNAMKTVKAAPTKYGPSAMGNVQSAVSASTFTAQNIPTQISSVATFSGKLADYANTNKIEVPSKEQTDKMAKDMEKE